MNRLSGILLASASSLALLVMAQPAGAGTVSPTGGGTITYSSGTAADSSGTTGGVAITGMADGATANVNGVTLSSSAAQGLNIQSTGSLSVTSSGAASSISSTASGSNSGFLAVSGGTGSVTVDTSGVAGSHFAGKSGIVASATGGDVFITTGTGTITSNASLAGSGGIYGQVAGGTGGVTVINNSVIQSGGGTFAYGIYAFAQGGSPINITTNANVTAATGIGFSGNGSSAMTGTIASGAVVTGTTAGVAVLAGSTGTFTLNVNGKIAGGITGGIGASTITLTSSATAIDGVVTGTIDGGSSGANSLTFNGTSLTATQDASKLANFATITKAGTGTWIVTGSTGFTSAITISGGTLQYGNSTTFGSLGGDITDNANLTLVTASGGNGYGSVITGTGTVTTVAPANGSVTLFSDNNYNGGTTISSGSLILGAGGTAGSAGTGPITDNGTLGFYRTDPAPLVFANAISGPGGLTLLAANTATVQLTGSNNYTGTTSILGGTLLFTATAPIAAASTFNVGSGATLDLQTSATLANLTGAGTVLIDQLGAPPALGLSLTSANFTGTISENSGKANTVTILTGGNVILAGANNWTGATTINTGGTLTIGNGGTTGNIPSGPLTDNGTFVFNRSDTVTYAGAFSGSGNLVQAGSGTLLLTGVNTFTGTTTVNAGVLSVNGSSVSSVTVNSGGALQGNGSVGGATINSGGKLAPGNSIGTLTVNGPLTFASGATYVAEVSPTAADKVIVNGVATLGGTLALVPASGTYVAGTDYVLVSATSISGSGFTTVTGAVPGFTNTIQYSAKAVDLILSTPAAAATPAAAPAATPATTPAATPAATPAPTVITTFLFSTYGITPNQIAAGNAVTQATYNAPLYAALGNIVQANVAAVPAALGQLAGDIHASIRSAAIEDSRIIRDAVLNRLDNSADGISVWSTLYGGYGSVATDGNAAALHHDSSGVMAGADLKADDNVRLGAAFAYSSTNASTFGGYSAAKGKLAHLIAYAGYTNGAMDLKLGGAYDFGNLRLARSITPLSYGESDSQSQRGTQIFATGGWKFSSESAMFEPYIGVADIAATSGAFAETGDIAALSGAAKTDSQTYTTLGAKAALDGLALGNGMAITPKIDLGWQHSFRHLRPGQSVAFQSINQSFTVLGVPLGMDAAAVQFGFDLAIAPDVTLNAGYDGSFSSSAQNNAIRAGLNLSL